MLHEPNEIECWKRVKKLGSGGFGEVWLWENKSTSQKIAVKKCVHLATDDKLEERWEREVSLMTNEIFHENIVRGLTVEPPEYLKQLCTNTRLPPLIMEYCENGDLRQLLSQRHHANGLPELEVRNVLNSLRNAIMYLHSLSITHRDIKPENLVVTTVNGNNVYKLTDLGYAKFLDYKTIEASHVGTIGYLAPELICDDRCSCTVDYWSFGVIAFEIICGCRPFIPHHQIVQFIVKIKEKKSEHIAISEDNKENFTYHTELFKENHISPTFKVLMEEWLKLALERDGRQRGKVFEKLNGAPPDAAPQLVFKFFPTLEKALRTNVLTIFCLHTYRLYSYEVSEATTFEELVNRISNDTKIPIDEIYIILPAEQKIDRITVKERPIDLYLPNFYDKPMLYCTYLNHILSENIKPDFSPVIKDILENHMGKWKPFYIMEFAKHSLFFITDECERYKMFVYGLKSYVEYINYDIVKYKRFVETMRRQEAQTFGAMEMLKITITHAKEILDEKLQTQMYKRELDSWEEKCFHKESNVDDIKKACERLEKRYNSALKRSETAIQTPLLNDKQIDDYFSVLKAQDCYEELKFKKMSNSLDPKSYRSMYHLLFDVFKERDKLLQNSELKLLQNNASMVHEEFRIIQKLVQDALQEIQKINTELCRFNNELVTSLCRMVENYANPNIPNIDRIMGDLALNDEISRNTNFVTGLQSLMSMPMESSCFGEGNDTKLLVEEQQQILEATRGLIMDIDSEITAD